jgi:hypothetical protein
LAASFAAATESMPLRNKRQHFVPARFARFRIVVICERVPRERLSPLPAGLQGIPRSLKGIIFGPTGCGMTATHTRKQGRLYRYYMASDLLKHEVDCPVRRAPAGEIENAVVEQVRGLLRAPEIIVRTWRKAKQVAPDIDEREVREALHCPDPLWYELFPAEQARVVQLLVERVDVNEDGLDIRLRTEGLTNIANDLWTVGVKAGAA